jgi:hypothetical protein
MSESMVIFSKAFDFLDWLLARAEGFPRSQRFVVTKRLQDALLDFYELLFDANARYGQARVDTLRQADVALDKVRHYLRLVTKCPNNRNDNNGLRVVGVAAHVFRSGNVWRAGNARRGGYREVSWPLPGRGFEKWRGLVPADADGWAWSMALRGIGHIWPG